MKKIFVTREIPGIAYSMLREKGYGVEVNSRKGIPSKKDIITFLKKKNYDGVITTITDPVDGEVFDAAPSVKVFANYGVGFNNFDLAAARERGIAISNAPGDFNDSIAEHALALILALSTRTVEGDMFVRKGKYKGWEPLSFIGTDLRGKTLGIVGGGRIGEKVAMLANALGMKVAYSDVRRNSTMEGEHGVRYVESLGDLLKESDVVSLHVPLLPSTHHLIDRDKLALMKPTAFLINTARGPVVDEHALIEALEAKQIAGAALDVYEFEPKVPRALRNLPNVVLTPHIASASDSARNKMAVMAAENLISFFETGKLVNPVYE